MPRMPPSPSRWTLRSKLLASVLALFTVVMLATSALTVLETRRYLETQLAEDLDGATGRELDRPANANANGLANRNPNADQTPRSQGRGPVGAPGGGDILVLGLTSDGTIATDSSGIPLNSVVNDQGVDDALDAEQVAT